MSKTNVLKVETTGLTLTKQFRITRLQESYYNLICTCIKEKKILDDYLVVECYLYYLKYITTRHNGKDFIVNIDGLNIPKKELKKLHRFRDSINCYYLDILDCEKYLKGQRWKTFVSRHIRPRASAALKSSIGSLAIKGLLTVIPTIKITE